MKCHECKEQIEVGEASLVEPHNGRNLFFHTGCHSAWRVRSQPEKAEMARQLNAIADLARTIR